MQDNPTFDRIVPEGKAMGFWHDKALFCTGPLPGEMARVTITREKRRWAEANLDEIVAPSAHRTGKVETHHMACSPWQGVDYDYQIELKQGMLTEIYGRPELKLSVADFKRSPALSGYRNKLEFSLVLTNGTIELAFHRRGRFDEYELAPQGCLLGSDAMNAAAIAVRDILCGLPVEGVVDTLTVRQGDNGAIVCVIQISERLELDWSPLIAAQVSGMAVVMKSSSGFKTLWSHSALELKSKLGALELAYPWDAFSQVNPPAFHQALDNIVRHTPPDGFVVDLYGGAGAIGLSVAAKSNHVAGIEIIDSAVKLANANAQRNDINNYRAYAASSEKLDPEVVRGADTVIVDPPRAGLSEKVVDYLIAAQPSTIIYLSCNPVTQARDVMSLTIDYDTSEVMGYDFYPGTLHMESLVVLKRR